MKGWKTCFLEKCLVFFLTFWRVEVGGSKYLGMSAVY